MAEPGGAHAGARAQLGVGDLTRLWVDVTRAGGPVGFLPDAPESEVATAAAQAVAAVEAGREHVVTRWAGDRLVGVVFVVPGPSDHTGHRALVLRLMVSPSVQSKGLGTELLDAAVDLARRLGLELLLLSVRQGHELERFYGARGWDEVGRFPGGIRIGPSERRDEVWFARRIEADPRPGFGPMGPTNVR